MVESRPGLVGTEHERLLLVTTVDTSSDIDVHTTLDTNVVPLTSPGVVWTAVGLFKVIDKRGVGVVAVHDGPVKGRKVWQARVDLVVGERGAGGRTRERETLLGSSKRRSCESEQQECLCESTHFAV